MINEFCFVSVEFVDDPNVVGAKYWYESDDSSVRVGDIVSAPLGRHNNLQNGVVREVRFCTEYDMPYPIELVKNIKYIVKRSKDVQNNR